MWSVCAKMFWVNFLLVVIVLKYIRVHTVRMG